MNALSAVWNHRIWLVNNPIILRELIVRLRSGNSFLFLGLFLTLAFIVITLTWTSFSYTFERGQNWERTARELFMIINLIQGLAVACLVPLISAAIVNSERECDTWDLLITTPINMLSVIAGKFLSSILFVWLILFSLLPVYGIFFLIGAISLNEVLFIFFLMTETIIVIGMMGLFFSILFKRSVKSISATYIAGFLYIFGLPFFRPLMMSTFSNRPSFGSEFMASPFPVAVIYFMNESLPPGIGTWTSMHPYFAHILWNAGITLAFLLLSLHFLRRKEDSKPIRLFNRKLATVNTPSKRAFSKGRGFPEGKNPVYIKDFRELCGGFRIFITLAVIFGLSFFLLICAVNMSSSFENRTHFLLAWYIMTPIFIMPYAANAIRNEFDRDTYDILATTMLTPKNILNGKIMAGSINYMIRFVAFTGLSATLICIEINFSSPRYSTLVYDMLYGNIMIAMVTSWFMLSTGLWFSTIVKKSLTAYALTFLTGLLLYVGFLLPLFIFEEFLRMRELRTLYYPLFGIFSPLFLAINYDIHNYSDFNGYRSGRDWTWSGTKWWFLIALQMLWMLGLSFLFQHKAERNMSRKTR